MAADYCGRVVELICCCSGTDLPLQGGNPIPAPMAPSGAEGTKCDEASTIVQFGKVDWSGDDYIRVIQDPSQGPRQPLSWLQSMVPSQDVFPGERDRLISKHYTVGDAVLLTTNTQNTVEMQGYNFSWGIVQDIDPTHGWITLQTGTSPASVRKVPASGVFPYVNFLTEAWTNSNGKEVIVTGEANSDNPWVYRVRYRGSVSGEFDQNLRAPGMKREHGEPQLADEEDDRTGLIQFDAKRTRRLTLVSTLEAAYESHGSFQSGPGIEDGDPLAAVVSAEEDILYKNIGCVKKVEYDGRVPAAEVFYDCAVVTRSEYHFKFEAQMPVLVMGSKASGTCFKRIVDGGIHYGVICSAHQMVQDEIVVTDGDIDSYCNEHFGHTPIHFNDKDEMNTKVKGMLRRFGFALGDDSRSCLVRKFLPRLKASKVEVMGARSYELNQEWLDAEACDIPVETIKVHPEYLRRMQKGPELNMWDLAVFDLPSARAPRKMRLNPPEVIFVSPQAFTSILMVGVAHPAPYKFVQMASKIIEPSGKLGVEMAKSSPGTIWAAYDSTPMQSGGGVFALIGQHLAGDGTQARSEALLFCGVHTGSLEWKFESLNKQISLNNFCPVESWLPRSVEASEQEHIPEVKSLRGAFVEHVKDAVPRYDEEIITDFLDERDISQADAIGSAIKGSFQRMRTALKMTIREENDMVPTSTIEDAAAREKKLKVAGIGLDS